MSRAPEPNSRVKKSLRLLSFLMTLCISACGNVADENKELNVSAAVSLKDALTEIATEFKKRNPDAKLVFNFAASGQLSQQISQGAPADLFISAAREQIDELDKKGILEPNSIHPCAGNRLVVLSKKERMVSSFSELAHAERLVIGNPKTVPAGAYAVQALQKAKIYEKLSTEHRLVLAEDASQILAYVEGGDVDAGMVYNTDALLAKKSKICFVVPVSFTKPMLYEAAIIRRSSHQELARKFMDFLIGSESAKAFQARGFSR